MERPGILPDDLYYHHANFIVRFFPGQAVELIHGFGKQDKLDQDKIATCVKNRCRDLGRSYEDIMNLAHNRQWDEIQRIKSESDPSSSQLLQSRDNSLPSTPLRPTIPFANPGYTNQNHPPSPAPTSSTSRSLMPPPLEYITVLGPYQMPLTIQPTLDGWNHIRTDVAERLGVKFLSPQDGSDETYPGNRQIRPPPYCFSVKLSFVRQASNTNKSHWLRFFLNDTLDKADVLVNYAWFQNIPKYPDHGLSSALAIHAVSRIHQTLTYHHSL